MVKQKVLIEAVELVVAIVVIVVGIALISPLISSFKQTGAKANTVMENTGNMDLKLIAGQESQGYDVISYINTKAAKDLTITVTTLSGGTAAYTTPNYTVADKGDKNYIEPSGTFTAQIIKNTNNTITGLTFTQKN